MGQKFAPFFIRTGMTKREQREFTMWSTNRHGHALVANTTIHRLHKKLTRGFFIPRQRLPAIWIEPLKRTQNDGVDAVQLFFFVVIGPISVIIC